MFIHNVLTEVRTSWAKVEVKSRGHISGLEAKSASQLCKLQKESNITRMFSSVSLWRSVSSRSVRTLTWCWWGVQIHLLAVLPVARLVAASHPQHVHAVHLQPVNHSAAPAYFIQSLPAPAGRGQSSPDPTSGRPSGYDTSPAVLDGEVPSGCRLLGQSPAQEELVVGQRTLGINHWCQGNCEENIWSEDVEFM